MSAAFTLVEVVIGASLMSIILVAAYLCLNSGLTSQKLIEARAEVIQSARVAMALVTADLRCACPLAKQYQFLGMHRSLGDRPADDMDFATHNYRPRRPREGDFCEISYFLDKGSEVGQFSLWRRRNPTIAPDPLVGGRREEIARGLRGVRFEYYDGYEWYDEWGDPEGRRVQQEGNSLAPSNLSGMPEAVRVTLMFEPNPGATYNTADTSEPAEAPLVFQTVARLNLADSASASASGGSTNAAAANSGGASPGQVQPGQPGGGPNR